MADFGRRGVELLKEIVNHDRDSLSAYNEDLMRTVINEINEHEAIARRIIDNVPSNDQTPMGSEGQTQGWEANRDAGTAVIIHVQSAIRNKKLALAYLLQRLERLKTIRWGSRSLPPAMAANCSPQELEFYKEYDRLLNSYMGNDGGVGQDLTLDLCPPKSNNVLVKVLETQGEMLFSFGQANLSRGTLHHLPVEEAEPLIREGVVELLE